MTSDERTNLLRNKSYDDEEYKQIKYGSDDGIRPNKSELNFSRNTLLVTSCILLTELCERLTYYSVIANMVLYCTSTLKLTSSTASTVTLVFSGTVYLIPVLGGYVSDTYLGKYNTILGSGMIYIVGLFLLPATAVDYEDWFGADDSGVPYNLSVEMRRTYFFIGLVLIAVGTGGIKANVGPFGAQQVNDLGSEATQIFFNWFYWFINAGSLIANIGVAYIQQNISFAVGFLIPLISMLLAIIIFVTVRSRYVHTVSGGSLLLDSIGVCCATKCRGFDESRRSYGGPYSNEMVDGVISVLRVIPIFLFIVFFWAIYAQMSTTYFLQGERMDVKVGDTVMPVAALNVFNNVIIMLTIPVVDRIIYPLLAKYNRSPSQLQRIGFGFILAGLSVVVAGVIEIYRKADLSKTGGFRQVLAGESFNASTLSVFLQVPQFAFVGAGEVFASISGYEFAYSQSPSFMQGVVMGMFLMTNGIGFYISEAILSIVRGATGTEPPDSWYPDELNDGKVEYLFFLMAGLMTLNILIYIIVAKRYEYRRVGSTIMYEEQYGKSPGYEDNKTLSTSAVYSRSVKSKDDMTSNV